MPKRKHEAAKPHGTGGIPDSSKKVIRRKKKKKIGAEKGAEARETHP